MGKTPDMAQRHYVESIPNVSSRYSEGIDNSKNWKTNSMSPTAKANYEAGIAQSIRLGLREKGLAKVSEEEWKAAAKNKGAASIGNAMTLAADKYGRNVAASINAANSFMASAPARTTDYKTNVNNRLLGVITAMKKASGKL